MSLSFSWITWLVIGAGAVVAIIALVAILAYPKDNSF